MKSCNIFLLSFFLALSAQAVEGAIKVLSFQQWKDSQTIEAENRSVRAANKLVMAKTKGKDAAQIMLLEKEASLADRSFELSKDYSIEDYFLVYLMGSEGRPEGSQQEVLRAAAKMMSSEDMAELMRVWMKNLRPQASEAKSPKTSWLPGLNSRASRMP